MAVLCSTAASMSRYYLKGIQSVQAKHPSALASIASLITKSLGRLSRIVHISKINSGLRRYKYPRTHDALDHTPREHATRYRYAHPIMHQSRNESKRKAYTRTKAPTSSEADNTSGTSIPRASTVSRRLRGLIDKSHTCA